jgi:predicted Zn-dependent protease
VAQRGRYYGPFAQILLSVIYMREKRPREAEKLLAGLIVEFPENPLIRRELARAGELARRGGGVAGN